MNIFKNLGSFLHDSAGWWHKGCCYSREDKGQSQKGKRWFTGLTNAVVGEYNCVRIGPHLGVNKEAKRHHSHCKQCGASCHADAAKTSVRVTVHLMLAYSLSRFLITTSQLMKRWARNAAGYSQFLLYIRLEKKLNGRNGFCWKGRNIKYRRVLQPQNNKFQCKWGSWTGSRQKGLLASLSACCLSGWLLRGWQAGQGQMDVKWSFPLYHQF